MPSITAQEASDLSFGMAYEELDARVSEFITNTAKAAKSEFTLHEDHITSNGDNIARAFSGKPHPNLTRLVKDYEDAGFTVTMVRGDRGEPCRMVFRW